MLFLVVGFSLRADYCWCLEFLPGVLVCWFLLFWVGVWVCCDCCALVCWFDSCYWFLDSWGLIISCQIWQGVVGGF